MVYQAATATKFAGCVECTDDSTAGVVALIVACFALVENESGFRWSEPMLHLSPRGQQLCFFEPGYDVF